LVSIEPGRETDMKGIENGDRVLIIEGENLPISCSIYFNETLVKEVVDNNHSLQRKKIIRKCFIPSLQKVLQDSLNNDPLFFKLLLKNYFNNKDSEQDRDYRVVVSVIHKNTDNDEKILADEQVFTYGVDKQYFDHLQSVFGNQNTEVKRYHPY